MIKAMRVDKTVICFINGKMYRKECASDEELLSVFETVSNTDETNNDEIQDLLALMADKAVLQKEKEAEEKIKQAEEEIAEQKSLLDWMEDIKQLGDEHFEVVGIRLYMKGINITIPEFLAKEFAIRRNNKEDLSAMINFWKLCALNSDPRCREDLYKFLINNKLSLTPSGYFVAYRNVNVKNEGNKEQNEFVSTQWSKVKAQKKSPKNYVVAKDLENDCLICVHIDKYESICEDVYEVEEEGEYEEDEPYTEEYSKYSFVGNLKDLYEESLKADEETQTVYTDGYTGKMRIVIGEPVSIPRSACNSNPDETCSRGLHAANSSWLTRNYFGSVGLAVLVNPMNVVAVPYTDGGKLRCCEYLPICTIEYDENGKVIPIDTHTFEYDYAQYTQAELEKMLASTELEELKSHDIVPKEISLVALKTIIHDLKDSLDEMTKTIKSRTVNV
jgi:hypothetical protein